MKYFLTEQNRIWQLEKNKKVYVLLDYDGTLTPIVSSPERARLKTPVRALLRRMARYRQCALAVISGRSLSDVKDKVKIKGIIYAGNHGLEIDYRGRRIHFFEDRRFSLLLEKFKSQLRKDLKGIKGVLLEDKKLALTIHFRRVDKKRIPEVKAVVSSLLSPPGVRRLVTIASGKMVLELRPASAWGKGDLVNRLFHDVLSDRKRNAVFYFGDDRTDEDVFKILKGKGYSIVVGKERGSAAGYYLRNAAEVIEVLKRMEREVREEQ